MRHERQRRALFAAIVPIVVAFGCTSPKTGPMEGGTFALIGSPERPVASDDVPAELAERVRRAAEREDANRLMLDEQRVVFVGTERVRWKLDRGDEDPRFLVRVVHYRYDDDAAIHTLVDASDMTIVDRRETPHLATNLSRAELEEATRLVLGDPEVRERLGEYLDRVEVEALVVRTTDESDPIFGRRVVRMLFRVGRDYLGNVPAVVDLTNRTVSIEGRN